MIPQYPDSRQITLEDKPTLDAVFWANQPEISAYSFTNIFAWREMHNSTISRIDDHILVLNSTQQRRVCLQPLGGGPAKPVIQEMMRRTDRPVVFERLSEHVKPDFEECGFTVESDRDNSDYVYASRDLIQLAGRKYDAKRNFVARAKSQIDYEYVRMEAAVALECEDFADLWCEDKMCETVDGLRRERCAVNQMLINFDSLGVIGGAIRVDGAIVAFSIGERLNDDTLVIHVEKADSGIGGLYQLINNEFCAAEAGAYKYVNREQDLGVAGLRKAKESYHPVRMIPTFRAKTP